VRLPREIQSDEPDEPDEIEINSSEILARYRSKRPNLTMYWSIKVS
jgi:hypothetical protein